MNQRLSLFYVFVFAIFGIIIYLLSVPKEKLFEAKWNDIGALAITLDGEISTTFPTTNDYKATVSCTTGTGSVSWNGTKWVLTTSGITKGSTKCNVIFNKLKTFAETILMDNEVKIPITTPGAEVSAYKESEVTNTSSSSVSSTYQAHYVTYGTGWEPNGTKFNLTGTAVTTDTYANSYQNLVGKYLPASSISSSGSSTAGTMMTTTNLSTVYYVVSATQDNFKYKAIGSNKNTTEAILASTEDDYGTSYYFRGTVTNNYVEFANKCWRIVRIGGDNTIKLILHNDNTAGVTNPCSSVNNSSSAAFIIYNSTTFTSKFNAITDDNAYVGFMYGTDGSTTYEKTHANKNKSTILTYLETWYNNNLKTYGNVIDDNVFCNDKSIVTDTSYNPSGYKDAAGLGYAKNTTYYGATKRLISSTGNAGGMGPSLKCSEELSKITSKVGLITADELAYAGYAAEVSGSESYLQENAKGNWWSMSPYDFHGALANSYYGGTAYVWIANGFAGSLTNDKVSSGSNARSYISLRSTTKATGDGTSENPYKVII